MGKGEIQATRAETIDSSCLFLFILHILHYRRHKPLFIQQKRSTDCLITQASPLFLFLFFWGNKGDLPAIEHHAQTLTTRAI